MEAETHQFLRLDTFYIYPDLSIRLSVFGHNFAAYGPYIHGARPYTYRIV